MAATRRYPCRGSGWTDETYLKLALHTLVEIAHLGGELGLYLREGV